MIIQYLWLKQRQKIEANSSWSNRKTELTVSPLAWIHFLNLDVREPSQRSIRKYSLPFDDDQFPDEHYLRLIETAYFGRDHPITFNDFTTISLFAVFFLASLVFYAYFSDNPLSSTFPTRHRTNDRNIRPYNTTRVNSVCGMFCLVKKRDKTRQGEEQKRNKKKIHFIRIELNKFIFLSLQYAEPSSLHSWHSNIKHSFWHSIGVITVVSNYVTVNHPPTRSKIYIVWKHPPLELNTINFPWLYFT